MEISGKSKDKLASRQYMYEYHLIRERPANDPAEDALHRLINHLNCTSDI